MEKDAICSCSEIWVEIAYPQYRVIPEKTERQLALSGRSLGALAPLFSLVLIPWTFFCYVLKGCSPVNTVLGASMFVFLKLRLFAVIWAPGTPARVHRALGAGPCSCLPCWPAHEACLVLVSAVPPPCVVLFSAGAHATALPPPGGLSAFRPGL